MTKVRYPETVKAIMDLIGVAVKTCRAMARNEPVHLGALRQAWEDFDVASTMENVEHGE